MANERNLRQGLKSLANSDIKGQLSITGAGASVPMTITGATNTILEMRDQASGDVLSLFKSNGDELFKVTTSGITVGGSYTLPLTDGTAGQALTTNGSGALTYNTVLSAGDNISTLTNDSGYLTGITAESIGDLSDVTLTSTVAGSLLVQQADASFLKLGAGTWTNSYVELDDLKDVATGASSGDVLTYSGTTWEPGSFNLQDLANVDGSLNVGTSPLIGNVLRYDGTDWGFAGSTVSYTTYNNTPSTILYGAVVKKNGINSGTTEDYFTAGNATSNTDTILGLALREMTTGDPYGSVLENGIIGNVDTSSFSTDDKLYVSTSGTLTATPPTTGPVIYIGRVLSSSVNGAIHVQVEQNNAGGVVSNATFSEGESVIWDGDAFVNGNPSVLIDVHNDSGAQIDKGEAVYISGEHASGKPTIAKAANGSSSTMPAAGLLQADIANGAEGKLVVSGALGNLDTSAFTAGDALYIDSTAGALTSTRPTATSALVQKVGIVTRDHASSGEILVMGANRANDIPNDLDLDTLTDVTIVAGTLATGQVLEYNAISSVFTNVTPTASTLQQVTDAGTSTDDIITTGGYVTTGNVTAIGTGNNTFTGNINASSGVTALDNTLSKAFVTSSTDSTASDWTALEIYRHSNTPAADDILGSVVFNGEDGASTKMAYGSVSAEIVDPAAVSAAGAVVLKYGETGTLIEGLKVSGDGVEVKSAYILPASAGTSGQVLKYPSSGTTLEWGDGGGTAPVAYYNESFRTFTNSTGDLYYWFPGDDDYGLNDQIAENLSSLPTATLGVLNYGHIVPSGSRTFDVTFIASMTDGSGNNISVYNSQDVEVYFYRLDQATGWDQIGSTQTITMDATNTNVPKEFTYTISSETFTAGQRFAVVCKGTQNVVTNTFFMWGYNVKVT